MEEFQGICDEAKAISDLMDSDLTVDYAAMVAKILALSSSREQEYLINQLKGYY